MKQFSNIKSINITVVFDPDGETGSYIAEYKRWKKWKQQQDEKGDSTSSSSSSYDSDDDEIECPEHPCHSNLHLNATCSKCHPARENTGSAAATRTKTTHPAIDPCEHMAQVITYASLNLALYSCYTRSFLNYFREMDSLPDYAPVNFDDVPSVANFALQPPFDLNGRGALPSTERHKYWWEVGKARTALGQQPKKKRNRPTGWSLNMTSMNKTMMTMTMMEQH